MEAYNSFAKVYDLFMDNIPYDEWCKYLIGLLREYGVKDGLVLDLGCGTGNVTQRLSRAGYDMIGVDNSAEMLEIAMDKKCEEDADVLYLLQDMREFELYGTVKAVVSICDSMNYITDEEDMLEVFELVNNYLDPGGIFIFDLSTIYKYREVIGNQTIAENREEASFIWDNFFDEEQNINEYELAIFLPEGDDGLYRKYEEVHYQRGYDLEKIKELLEKSNMEFLAAYDAFSKEAPRQDSERIYVIARESGKER